MSSHGYNRPDFYPSTRPELPQDLIDSVVESRMFSGRDDFTASGITYDRWAGKILNVPFTVALTTIHQDLLGVGIMLGGIVEDDGTMPVVQVQDRAISTGSVEFLGSECFWLPSDEGVSEALASPQGSRVIVPASHYAVWLDQPETYESLRA